MDDEEERDDYVKNQLSYELWRRQQDRIYQQWSGPPATPTPLRVLGALALIVFIAVCAYMGSH